MARGFRAELSEVLQVVEREVVAEQVEQRVEQHRRVACGQDEAIAQRPLGVVGIEAQMVCPDLECRPRQAHGGTGMAATRPLDGIDGKGADGVLGFLSKGEG